MAFKPYFDLKISKRYSEDERAAIAAEVLDYIVERTEKGKDKDGDRFPKYTKQYSELKGQGNVDLRLSGEMLESIALLANEKGKIRLGYDSGSSVAGKVEGNCIGSYGNNPNPAKARNFLGIEQAAFEKILKNYPLDDIDTRRERVQDVAAGDVVAKDLLDVLNLEFDI